MNVTTFPDWFFDFDETRMGWYNINATRVTGNSIGIAGTDEYEGLRRIVTDIVNFELTQNRTYSYWNEVFIESLASKNIPVQNDLEIKDPNDHFKSWEIKVADMLLSFNSSEPQITLYENEKIVYSKKWSEFNGDEFFKLLDQISTASNTV